MKGNDERYIKIIKNSLSDVMKKINIAAYQVKWMLIIYMSSLSCILAKLHCVCYKVCVIVHLKKSVFSVHNDRILVLLKTNCCSNKFTEICTLSKNNYVLSNINNANKHIERRKYKSKSICWYTKGFMQYS